MTNKMIFLCVFGVVASVCFVVPTVSGMQCERITVPACQGLGYNMTAMPNLAGHTSQTDAENMVSAFLDFVFN